MAKQVLTDEHCAICDRNMRLLAEMEAEIQRAKAAGADVEEYELRRQYLLNRYQLIKKAYFGDRV